MRTVWLRAVHVVNQPKPMVKPQAMDAIIRSCSVTGCGTKCGDRSVIITIAIAIAITPSSVSGNAEGPAGDGGEGKVVVPARRFEDREIEMRFGLKGGRDQEMEKSRRPYVCVLIQVSATDDMAHVKATPGPD